MRKPYKDLSLQQVRTFVEVCRLGSYTEAGRQRHISTSTAWEQVRGLERQFEIALLESREGAVRPTAEGKRLLEMVLPLLAGLDSAKEVLQQERGRPPASITLVSGMRMLLEEVGAALGPFRQRYPAVRVRCLYAEDKAIESIVEHSEADLGLVLEPGPGRTRRPTLLYEPAYELEFILVAPSRHPLLAKSGVRLADVVRHPLVIGVPGTTSRRRIEEVFDREGLLNRMHVAVETNSAALTFACVRQGAGVGITAGYRRGFLGRGLGTRSLRRWFGAARYVFLRPCGAHVPPALQEFTELIRAAVSAADAKSP